MPNIVMAEGFVFARIEMSVKLGVYLLTKIN